MIINATEEEERGAVLRGEFLGKKLHAHFLLIARFLLVSATAMADPKIDPLSFFRNEIDFLEFLQQFVDHESNFLFSFCSS
jgi:hypothetical protein